MTEDDLHLLRTRYADYCSGRIAARFLELSPEEVWDRAQRGGAEPPADGRGFPPVGSTSYLLLARMAALSIAAELGLPDFDEFAELYRRDPARFAAELAGYDVPETAGPG